MLKIGLATAVALSAAPAVAQAGVHFPAGWQAGYYNKAGDQLVVGSDDSGEASFLVALPTNSVKGSVEILVDADGNARTGDRANGGADYRFAALLPSGSWDFFRRRGSSWASTNLPTLRGGATIDAGFDVNRRDLGGAAVVHAVAYVTTAGKRRRIPDSGTVRYDLRPLKLAPHVSASVAAGKLVLRLRLTRSDNGGYIEGDPLCSVHVGTKILFASSLATAGRDTKYRGSCTWRFASSLKGKRATASIGLQAFQETITRTYTFTIK